MKTLSLSKTLKVHRIKPSQSALYGSDDFGRITITSKKLSPLIGKEVNIYIEIKYEEQ